MPRHCWPEVQWGRCALLSVALPGQRSHPWRCLTFNAPNNERNQKTGTMSLRITLLSTLAVVSTAAIAQPTLNAGNNLPSAGDVFVTSTGTYPTEGSVGAAQTFGFWMLQQTGNRNFSFLSPSVSSTVVTGANLLSTDGGSDTLFWRGTATGLELLADKSGIGNVVYTDPVQELVYPLTYQTTWSDALVASYSVSGFPVQRTGNLTGVADSYGLLELPSVGINNVLRVRVRKEITDVSAFITVNRISETYYYFVDTVPHPVLKLQLDTAITGGGNPAVTKAAVWMYGAGFANIGELDMDDIRFTAYPNPASGPVNLSIADTDVAVRGLELLDATGRVVMQQPLVARQATELPGAFSTDGLAPGVYHVRLIGERSVLGTQRLVVQ